MRRMEGPSVIRRKDGEGDAFTTRPLGRPEPPKEPSA